MHIPKTPVSSFLTMSFRVGLAFALMAVILPLSPKMPSISLDGAWAYALSEAVGRGLVFGRDIVFTLGPYAPVYTKVFHPATDALTLFAGLLLALSTAGGLYLLMRGRGWQPLAVWFLLLPGIACSRDALFLAIPLIAGLGLLKTTRAVSAAGLLAPIGLLALVKGTFLLFGMAVLGLSACLLIKRREAGTLLSPLLTMSVFWMLAGQPVGALFDYLSTSIHMALAFSEPMALGGPLSDILLYLSSVTGILWVLLKSREMTSRTRRWVVTLCFLYLFVCFKAAFTRHGGHAFTAALAPLLVTLLLPAFVRLRDVLPALVPAAITFFTITANATAPDLLRNSLITWRTFQHGIHMRLTHPEWLRENHALTRMYWNSRTPLPQLPGRVDIYSFDQTTLLAANLNWSPRPVFQSYSVFDKTLAGMNRAHLLGEHAPDNILFRLAPVDNRLPALEDGASWPALLSLYQSKGVVQGFLWLEKKREAPLNLPAPERDCKRFKLGEAVSVAKNERTFATLQIKPSLTGRLITTLYHASPLHISLTRSDNTLKRYRINASMAEAGFLLSPLVESTDDFAALSAGQTLQRESFVSTFTVEAHHIWQWQRHFTVCQWAE
ncbi:hypothetical protein [Legionella geestiana]|nr:hypothetical protein [Legionella geestiana]QBS12355.1 hypothetical protein E4T54_06135 [Legionella geestiana]